MEGEGGTWRNKRREEKGSEQVEIEVCGER